ncbi:MAG: (Fe-S)-binding protein [Coriobacteriales bacterium]|nr:(Fe-S)-binding protein [Coriobacteriales bacterium]
MHIGKIEAEFSRIMQLPKDELADALLQMMSEMPELYQTLRKCCFCGHCTAFCEAHIDAPARMRDWRSLFAQTGIMPEQDSKLVMVDNEWHIFSAYRAIYGVSYPQFNLLSDLAELSDAHDSTDFADAAKMLQSANIDTLFFPGCSLASYAPHLVVAVGEWLNNQGINWALSLDCCGSPLMSAGLFERSVGLRSRILQQVRTCGIKRVLTVCPGCGEELAEVFGDDIQIVPLAELLLQKSDAVALDTNAGALTVFDSCHDRHDGRHGMAVRALLQKAFPNKALLQMQHCGKDTLCCGAGGAVSAFDADISNRRVWRVINEAKATGANTLVTMCPTCTYTIAFAQTQNLDDVHVQTETGVQSQILAENDSVTNDDGGLMLPSHHYLELYFNQTINWSQVFANLESMWTGEYAEWLSATFF